jgi:ribosomal protein S12 methylthiotransferase accessory factor
MTARPANLEQLLAYVSPRVGLIRSLSRIHRGAEEPNPPVVYQATLSHFDFRRAPPVERVGSGKAESEAEAMAAAIAEALERYCASQPEPVPLVRGPLSQLGRPALYPAECVLYSERQYARANFPYARFADGNVLTWVPARALPGGDEVLVPAALVYLQYVYQGPQEYLCPPTSNGLAAGPDVPAAVLGGLYELIERDGYLITWLNKLPAPRVDWSGLGGLPRAVGAHYRHFGIDVQVFNVTTDIPVYVMLALALDRSGRGPAAVAGLGCNLDPAAALRKSLLEVCQVRPGETLKYHTDPPQQRLRSFADVRTLEDHSALFAMPQSLAELAFLLDGTRSQRLQDLPNRARGETGADLDTCVGYLARAGSRAFYVDVSTPDLDPRALRVVRTLATGLQPIHFGYGEERLGGRRLYEVPAALGYAPGPRTEDDMNPCPHPLA